MKRESDFSSRSATIVTDINTIRELIDSAVFSVVEKQLPGLVQRATAKRYLTSKELQELTGFSARTLQHLRDSRQLPFIQDGRKILYLRDDVEAFLNARRIAARKSDSAGGGK